MTDTHDPCQRELNGRDACQPEHRAVLGSISDVTKTTDYRGIYDPNEGKKAKAIAAERRAARVAPEQYVPRERLIGRALCLLADGPQDASAWRDALGEVDDERVAELAPWVVVVPAEEQPSGWSVWLLEALRARAAA